ncbi:MULTISPECIES: beta strand repeat-containing protein [Calothrix]|uniref:S-layer family protein n=2 Tax=Calothrix TaxID=1186 RepID=A0ABR8AJY0_9CYAN|nr:MULTISPECIES: S-layer family protein [Calothrix]MBD2200361.1 S-layer family protein [Calothrix parietina FACHB-288]MBD2229005.1 S-layer family protein [Calothrix anomala FACHB-343]
MKAPPMTKKYGLHNCLQFGLVGFLGWLTISIFTGKTLAQPSNIIPDNTLGAESSQVITNFEGEAKEVITGGAIRQIHQFHSFSEFNIREGRAAYFFSPNADIQNIFARVTGNNPSEIMGRLGIFGNSQPNLYLINPNGIVFGNNASLDLQGSFVGTTANGIQFANQGIFSATNPQAVPLLTVNPTALFFNQIQANAGITNRSQAAAGKNLIAEDVTGLRVADSKSLLLVGGNINLDGGNLRAYGGNIELASLAAPGNIGLNITGDNNISLTVADAIERANVSLNQAAEVHVLGVNGGNIKIHTRDLNLAGDSKIRAGIEKTLGTVDSQSGNIEINATGTINLTDGSFISNVVRQGSVGTAGDINIATGSLNLSQDSFIDASTFGQGNSGKVSIIARDNISLTSSSEIYSSAEEGSVGNGGSINIQTGSLVLTQGSELNTKTLGQGHAGTINIKASDTISLDGFTETTLNNDQPGRIYSRITTVVNPEGTGKAGDIQIQTDSLQSSNGAFISSSTLGQGSAGNIIIDANNITFASESSIDSRVFNQGVGEGGNIWINTNNLSLLGGSQISTRVSGKGNAGNISVNARDSIKLDGIVGSSIAGIQSDLLKGGVGNAGNIEITTGSLSLTNGASIDNGTDGIGNAGNITINASETINIEGFGNIFTEQLGDVKLPSNIGSDVSFDGVGKGGDIRINTRELFLDNKGIISADTFGQGNGGNIFIQATETISLSNTNNIDFTQISTTVSDKARGNGGTINIQARNLLLDNASINGFTFGQGNAGIISIKVQDNLSLNNGSAFANSTAAGKIGNGGNIQIETGKLLLDNDSYFAASTNGQGNGGNIIVKAADNISIANKSSIFSVVSDTAEGNAGNIQIFAKSFSVSGESLLVNSNLGGKGNAGNISINTKENVSLTGGSFLSNGTSGIGNAGNIKIQAGGTVTVSGRSERFVSAISSGVIENGVGNSGDIEIVASSFKLSDDADLITLSNGKGNAGNVFISTLGDIKIQDSSNIATFIGQQGNAGKITIQSGGDIYISGTSFLYSIVYLNAVGEGGDIEIQGHNVYLADGAALVSATIGKGNAGNVSINSTGDISLTNGAQIRTDTLGQGNAGNIRLNAGDTILFDGKNSQGSRSGIATQVTTEEGFTGKGEGGNINVNARTLSITNSGGLSASSTGEGNAGDININTATVNLDNEGIIAAQTNSGNGGNINLNATDLLLLRRNSNISTTAGLSKLGGNGGNININAKFIVAPAQENSNISSDSFTGNGGNVEINSQGNFGIEARPKPTQQSDITASSELGVSGVVKINAPDTSSIPNSFTPLFPVIDTNALIANSCISRANQRQENSFMITGAGALPAHRPGEGLVSTYNTGEVRGVETSSRAWKKGDPIIEAEGFYRLGNGKLLLSRECSSKSELLL